MLPIAKENSNSMFPRKSRQKRDRSSDEEDEPDFTKKRIHLHQKRSYFRSSDEENEEDEREKNSSNYRNRKKKADQKRPSLPSSPDEKEEEEQPSCSKCAELAREARTTTRKKKASQRIKYPDLNRRMVKQEPKRRERYFMTTKPDVKIPHGTIKQEVYECRGTVREWDNMGAAADESGCPFDYIICSEARLLGSEELVDKNREPLNLLVKWTNYPIPTWESAAELIASNADFQRRSLNLDFVELDIREKKGDRYYELHFPNRYLSYERGRGNFGYVSNEDALYKNKLRANEHHFNQINAQHHIAPVLVEDWTGGSMDDETLRELDYIQVSVLTSRVRQAMEEQGGELKHLKCGKHCRTCTRIGRTDAIRYCCRLHESLEMCEDGIPRFIKDGAPERECEFRVECTDECECPPSKCGNRVVQRGRQHPLLIFRDPHKGWTVRTLTEFLKDEYVAEYVGVMSRKPTTGRSQQYDFSMEGTLASSGRRPFTLCAYAKGNETRFMSHSCEPNLFSQTTVIERDGLQLHHVAFHAARNLKRGEEACFDYFEGKGLDSDVDFTLMFEYCWCECPGCRFTKKLVDEYNRKEERDEK